MSKQTKHTKDYYVIVPGEADVIFGPGTVAQCVSAVEAKIRDDVDIEYTECLIVRAAFHLIPDRVTLKAIPVKPAEVVP